MLSQDGNTMQEQREEEPIKVDTAYIWEAIYNDGQSSLVEWERMENGEIIQHGFSEIALEQTTGMILHAIGGKEGQGAISVKIDTEGGMRPIFFRRHQSTLNFETGEVTRHDPIHVLGWQRTVDETFVSSYVYIFPDGSLLLSDRHDAV